MKKAVALLSVLIILSSCVQVRTGTGESGLVTSDSPFLTGPAGGGSSDTESVAVLPETESVPTEPATETLPVPETEPPEETTSEPAQTEPESSPAVSGQTVSDGGYKYCAEAAKYLEYITAENLTLVNKQNWVPEDYLPDLYKSTGMLKEAYFALQAMFAQYKYETGKKVSYNPKLAYRSYDYQSKLFEKYTKQEKANHPKYTDEQIKKLVNTYSAIPGQSEHHTGLCLDFTPVSSSFQNTDWFKWLSKNAFHFGFILRYGKNQIDITGYKYEPWHWRFVGRNAATYIFNHGITLEEYLGVYPPAQTEPEQESVSQSAEETPTEPLPDTEPVTEPATEPVTVPGTSEQTPPVGGTEEPETTVSGAPETEDAPPETDEATEE